MKIIEIFIFLIMLLFMKTVSKDSELQEASNRSLDNPGGGGSGTDRLAQKVNERAIKVTQTQEESPEDRQSQLAEEEAAIKQDAERFMKKRSPNPWRYFAFGAAAIVLVILLAVLARLV